MLVAGGLLDQPLQWLAVQSAGYLWSFVERVSAKGFESSTLKDVSEHKMYQQVIDARKSLPPRAE